MERNDFKVGDRVSVGWDLCDGIKGENKETGTVLDIYTHHPDGVIGIKFDKSRPGFHNLNGNCEAGFGWYVSAQFITKIEISREVSDELLMKILKEKHPVYKVIKGISLTAILNSEPVSDGWVEDFICELIEEQGYFYTYEIMDFKGFGEFPSLMKQIEFFIEHNFIEKITQDQVIEVEKVTQDQVIKVGMVLELFDKQYEVIKSGNPHEHLWNKFALLAERDGEKYLYDFGCSYPIGLTIEKLKSIDIESWGISS